MDQNLEAVQWGLMSVFGVALSLLIPHADQYHRAFLASGADEDYRQAERWARQIKGTAWTVLGALLLLSGLGAADAALLSLTPRAWLGVLVMLVAPLLAQLGFLGLVSRLVRPVPAIVTLTLAPPTAPRDSPMGQRPATVIRFVNKTTGSLLADWLMYDGKARGTPLVLPPGAEVTQATYAGHRFVIKDAGTERAIVTAAATPGKAVIADHAAP